MMKRLARWGTVLLLSCAAALPGCNAFDGLGDDGSREARLEEARIAMDHGQYDAAVGMLESLLSSNPGDAGIERTLAAAYAGRSGLDLLAIVAQAAIAADNASLSDISLLMKTLPNPVTDNNIADANRAIGGWTAVASGPDDYYSLALSQATLGLLTLAKDLVPPGGTAVDVTRIGSASAFPDADALTVYGAIDAALANLGPGRAGLDTQSDVLKSLATIRAEIDAAAGATTADKVRAYLGAQSWI
jgi:predicted small secreted protein